MGALPGNSNTPGTCAGGSPGDVSLSGWVFTLEGAVLHGMVCLDQASKAPDVGVGNGATH